MVFGIVVVLIGIILLLKVLVPGFDIQLNMVWPIVLLVFGVYAIIKNKKFSFFGILVSFIGIWFLFYNQGFIPEEYINLFWPIIVILFGVSIVLSTSLYKKDDM